MSATSSSETNKALVRRLIDVVNGGEDLDVLDETHASDFVAHSTLGGDINGLDAYRTSIREVFEAFSDFTVTIEDIAAEDDLVFYRGTYSGTHDGEFMDVPATGKSVSFGGMAQTRVEDGKITELWGHLDMLSLLQQLGVRELPDE